MEIAAWINPIFRLADFIIVFCLFETRSGNGDAAPKIFRPSFLPLID